MCCLTALGVLCVLLSVLCWTSVQGFYDHTDEVYDLTPANFQKLVLDSHFVWIVEFYAPWYDSTVNSK